MNKRFKILTLIGVFSAFVIGGMTLIVSSQTQNNKQEDKKTKIRQKIEQNGEPIAEFNWKSTGNPKDDENRQKRNKKFNNPNNPQNTVKLNETMQTVSYGGWTSRFPDPEFPNSSNFVAIGMIRDAKAYVSEDASEVYSEFTLQIGKILKDNTNLKTKEGELITLNRLGGKVRFPSGKIIFRGTDGLYMPKKDGEYLMFLNYDNASQSYHIITGYQFKNGKVEALDGLNFFGEPVVRYQNYLQYNGMDVNQFVNIVITNLNQGGK